MSGIAVQYSVRGDDEKISRALLKLMNPDRLFRTAHKLIGKYLVGETQERFRQEEGPDGKPWRQSARAKLGRGQTLSDTGRQKSSITDVADSREVKVGTNLIYARIHQLGGVILPKVATWLKFRVGDKWVKVKKVTMPARPFLGINQADEQEIGEIVNDVINNAIQGG